MVNDGDQLGAGTGRSSTAGPASSLVTSSPPSSTAGPVVDSSRPIAGPGRHRRDDDDAIRGRGVIGRLLRR